MPARNQETRADFAIIGANGEVTAIAEAKKAKDASRAWAEAWFRNLMHVDGAPLPRFVLLVTPEEIYVWKSGGDSNESIETVDARRLFATYVRDGVDPSQLSGGTFEFIVGAWLNDVSHKLWRPTAPDEVRVFVDSGLLDVLENGRVVSDLAA